MGDLQSLIGNPYNYNGYINPYGIGLMSLSPTIWKYRELIDPSTYIYTVNEPQKKNQALRLPTKLTAGQKKMMLWKRNLLFKDEDFGGVFIAHDTAKH